MEQFINNKIHYMNFEQEQLATLLADSDDLMVSGLIQQEIRRNEGLTGIYAAILDQYGWTNTTTAE